jgi:glutaredoxin|tara:strand:+ start:9788 stop:10177 length:390 start_codon:yes stop_codon:yes gene_type:complete
MAGIRWILGSLILFLNWVFSPKSITRNSVLQNEIDQQFAGYTLFHYPACPFCVKVRRVMKKYNLSLKLVDPRNCETGMQDLMEGGGILKVPCLKIQNSDEAITWMYESSSIISFLESQIPEAQEANNAK